jgi:hypothetical protein
LLAAWTQIVASIASPKTYQLNELPAYAPQADPTITGKIDAVKNFGRVAWKARFTPRAKEVPANSSGTGFIGRKVSEDMPDPELGGRGERARPLYV